MSGVAIITAVIILGIVWGGMVVFLTKAIKYEKSKAADEE